MSDPKADPVEALIRWLCDWANPDEPSETHRSDCNGCEIIRCRIRKILPALVSQAVEQRDAEWSAKLWPDPELEGAPGLKDATSYSWHWKKAQANRREEFDAKLEQERQRAERAEGALKGVRLALPWLAPHATPENIVFHVLCTGMDVLRLHDEKMDALDRAWKAEAERDEARAKLGPLFNDLAAFEELKRFIYETLSEEIPYTELGAPSPAHFRVAAAAELWKKCRQERDAAQAEAASLRERVGKLEGLLRRFMAAVDPVTGSISWTGVSRTYVSAEALLSPPAEGPVLPLGHEFVLARADRGQLWCLVCDKPRAAHEPAEGEKRG